MYNLFLQNAVDLLHNTEMLSDCDSLNNTEERKQQLITNNEGNTP